MYTHTWSIYQYKKSTIGLDILRFFYDGKVIFNFIPVTEIKTADGFTRGKKCLLMANTFTAVK